MKKFTLNLILIFGLFCIANELFSQNSDSELLLDGADSVMFYDIDTTGYWWAITKPFSNRYRININNYASEACEDVTFPVFSPDGLKWSFFAVYNSSLHRVDYSNDTVSEFPLDATDYGEIVYSPNGAQIAYSYFQDGNEIIQLPNRRLTVTNRFGKLFINDFGDSYTILGKRIDKYVININGEESTTYDSINPIGYWHSGNFVYTAFNGNNWEIYCGKRQLGSSYRKIIDAKINPNGTILAVLVQLNSGCCMSIVFNDDYYEPLYGKCYDDVWGLVLHPQEMLIGYGASSYSQIYIVQNSTEYYANGEIGSLFYTYNGDELIFTAMGEFGPYISVNGKRTDINISLYPSDIVAKKPNSESIALSTSITLLVFYYEKDEYATGIMCDQLSKTIFNRKTNRYEALGVISNRLYLVSCAP